MIHIECFGLIRRRTGVTELTLSANTVREALEALVAQFPAVADLVFPSDGKSHILVSLNGERFIQDLSEQLAPGSRMVLLSADSGG